MMVSKELLNKIQAIFPNKTVSAHSSGENEYEIDVSDPWGPVDFTFEQIKNLTDLLHCDQANFSCSGHEIGTNYGISGSVSISVWKSKKE